MQGHDEYHHDNGEGADFFDVGESLGAGGTGVWRGDKLYRALNFKGWRVIAPGPVRAIFELQYQPWDAAGLKVSETKRISLDAGHNLNHVVSIFKTTTPRPTSRGSRNRQAPERRRPESKAKQWAWLAEGGRSFRRTEGTETSASGSCCRATRSLTGKRPTTTTWRCRTRNRANR